MNYEKIKIDCSSNDAGHCNSCERTGEFGPVLLDLGWDMGLVNISNRDNGDVKNQNAYLSVGYKF